MDGKSAALVSLFVVIAAIALPHAQTVVPYSNATEIGYHIINISTYGTGSVVIGPYFENYTQNYITPNESGVTVNGHDYDLDLNAPIALYGQNMSYVELVQVNYIPRLHTVDFNLYQLQPPPTTSTTSVASTTTVSTTSVLPPSVSTTIASTTTIAQPSGLSGILDQIISLIRELFSHI